MKKNTKTILVLILVCAVIAVVPLVFVKNSEFGGADARAKELVGEIDSEYVQWIDSPIAPPGTETESLLFAIQAGIGTGIIGFGFGWLAARKKFTKKNEILNEQEKDSEDSRN